MALSSQSIFLYGYTVGVSNQNIDFKAASGGPVLTAILSLGDYSLTSLLTEVANEMNAVDPSNTYTAVADRTLLGGTQNRVSIKTSGSFLSILFGSGPNASTSASELIGFNPVDYSGLTTYTGAQTTGTTLMPEFIGYNYRDPLMQAKLFGAVNVSAAGVKESVVFNTQLFIDVDYKYEPKANLQAWQDLFYWLIAQKPFDYTPEITNPTYFFQCTLEKTAYDGKGLGYQMAEMLPNFPNLFQTGPLNMRIVLNYSVQQFTFGG